MTTRLCYRPLAGAKSLLPIGLLLLCLTGCDPAPQYQALPPGSTVLAFGDSITHGTGARAGQDFPSLLALQTRWQVINAGVPGDTARQAKSRLSALLSRYQPELVIVELGGNDFLRKRSASLVREDVLQIIRLCQAHGAAVVLVAIPRLSLLRASVGALRDSDIYSDLAADTGAVLIADILSGVLSDDTLRADQIHPNAQGYKVFTLGLIDELQRQGLLQHPLANAE